MSRKRYRNLSTGQLGDKLRAAELSGQTSVARLLLAELRRRSVEPLHSHGTALRPKVHSPTVDAPTAEQIMEAKRRILKARAAKKPKGERGIVNARAKAGRKPKARKSSAEAPA